MKSITITPKISSQGQITLPAKFLKEIGAQKGQRVTLRSAGKNLVELDSELPFMKYAGMAKGQITNGMDAAEYIRKMRDEDDNRMFQQ